jgi:hypothetical protein
VRVSEPVEITGALDHAPSADVRHEIRKLLLTRIPVMTRVRLDVMLL